MLHNNMNNFRPGNYIFTNAAAEKYQVTY